MSETAKLLKVFLVDKQLNGLTARLRAAERFLGEQTTQLAQLEARKQAIEAQLRQLSAAVANQEGEMARLDARIEQLRTQMNSAQTNREYKAFLTEINTIKADRSKIETGALEQMAQIDALKSQAAGIETDLAERERVKGVAADDKVKRAEEIREKVEALQKEREQLAADVPSQVMAMYKSLYHRLQDEAMAPVEVQDRKRHEFTCGACMMSIPVEIVNRLMTHGTITRCVSCQCILYMDQAATEAMQPAKR